MQRPTYRNTQSFNTHIFTVTTKLIATPTRYKVSLNIPSSNIKHLFSQLKINEIIKMSSLINVSEQIWEKFSVLIYATQKYLCRTEKTETLWNNSQASVTGFIYNTIRERMSIFTRVVNNTSGNKLINNQTKINV